MGRRLIITTEAIEHLKSIHHLYKGAPRRAAQIKKNILKGYATLRKFPFSGVRLDLSYYLEECRSLVVDKQYKIVYTVGDDYIRIIAIWDCRQDPLKLFDVIQ